MYSYVERNYGKTYLTEGEEKKINALVCRGIHSDCSLYFTKGILKEPVMRNYQYEYARKQRSKNLYEYHDNHRVVKNNIRLLTDMLKKTLTMREEKRKLWQTEELCFLKDCGVLGEREMCRFLNGSFTKTAVASW